MKYHFHDFNNQMHRKREFDQLIHDHAREMNELQEKHSLENSWIDEQRKKEDMNCDSDFSLHHDPIQYSQNERNKEDHFRYLRQQKEMDELKQWHDLEYESLNKRHREEDFEEFMKMD